MIPTNHSTHTHTDKENGTNLIISIKLENAIQINQFVRRKWNNERRKLSARDVKSGWLDRNWLNWSVFPFSLIIRSECTLIEFIAQIYKKWSEGLKLSPPKMPILTIYTRLNEFWINKIIKFNYLNKLSLSFVKYRWWMAFYGEMIWNSCHVVNRAFLFVFIPNNDSTRIVYELLTS